SGVNRPFCVDRPTAPALPPSSVQASSLDDLGRTMATVTESIVSESPAPFGGVWRAVTDGIAVVGALTLRGVVSVGAAARFTGDTLAALRDAASWLPQSLGQMWSLGVASL